MQKIVSYLIDKVSYSLAKDPGAILALSEEFKIDLKA